MDADDLLAGGYAKPVAPVWQPMLWFGAEALPMSAVILISFIMFGILPSFVAKLVVLGGAGCLIGILRYLGTEVDSRYFAATMGFPDRGEYVASATIEECDREDGGQKFLGFL